MSISINGSTGISGVNGSAATPAIQGGDADTGIFFGTDTASVATAGNERLIVDASGNINIDSGGVYYDAANNRLGVGTSSPNFNLSVKGSADSLMEVQSSSNNRIIIEANAAGNNRIYARNGSNGNGTLEFRTGTSTETMRIDSSGRLLVGTSSARSNLYGASYAPITQIETTGTLSQRTLNLTYNDNGGGAGGPILSLTATNGGTGSNTVVANNQELGAVNFLGADGTNPLGGAAITAYVDGTPGANDMPGRLVFSTSASGSSSPTERVRIDQSGNVKIGGTLPSSPNAEITSNGLIKSGGYPITRSFSYTKYSAYGYAGSTLNVGTEISNNAITGATDWRQATVTLMGFDGASIAYFHGIYSRNGGRIRATQLANSGGVTLNTTDGTLTWPSGVGDGSWYNTVLTVSYTAV